MILLGLAVTVLVELAWLSGQWMPMAAVMGAYCLGLLVGRGL